METESDHNAIGEEQWTELDSEPDDGTPGGPLSKRRADLWALVLEARGVPCRIVRSPRGRRLLVPWDLRETARNELRRFEEENIDWPPPPAKTSPLTENTLATLSVLLLLATFHNITLLDIPPYGDTPVNWTALGSADSAMILAGQWWRAVTALTLHADWLHLLGNLTIGGFFIVLLCRELGSGLAWTLLLGSGVLGNLANALLQPYGHDSIGASTLVFGAVGALAAVNLFRHRHHPQKRRALPVAAALALLALLGTEGKNTDLGAHLFGFLFGTGLGLAAEYLVARYGRPGRGLNIIMALACATAIAAAWWTALASA